MSQTPAELTFEQAMERLDEIVSSMESERMPLEEMVASYEEGARLLKMCRSRIDSARHRVELITQRANSPEAELEPFHPQEEPAEMPAGGKGSARTSTATPTTTAPRRKSAPSPDDDDIRLF
jgi:exodeoxyribonuclease VII small subunit